ncbi:MAG: dehydrogenase [Prevotella sp.]|nr:dehydrogenase [Prevotella sp.]
MADNYLENHMAEYEAKKAEYLKKKKSHLPKSNKRRSSDE